MRTMTSVVLALAIVLFPASASHGQADAGVSHHAASIMAHAEAGMDHAAGSDATGHAADIHAAETPDRQTGDRCCQDMCFSIALMAAPGAAPKRAANLHEMRPARQMVSARPSGFLRPPNT
ncbi:hypothetical protein [Sulfitobacter sabulilitoris]|nr:hypothetical protein [Sulfitobacter sabulilitoris]